MKSNHHSLNDKQVDYLKKHYPEKSIKQIARELNISPALIHEYLKEHPFPAKQPELSPGKKAAFWAASLLLPVVLLVVLELLLRLVGYGPDLRLFIPSPANPAYLQINPEVGLRYFPVTRVKPQTSLDLMAKEKPRDGFRIFVLGGSSAAGYPYLYNGSFSSILKLILKEYYPERKIEIINLAMPAVGSYTVRDLALELGQYQPDLILIYSGHNEFYGGLGVGSAEYLGSYRPLVLLFLKLRHWKLFQLMSDLWRQGRFLLGKLLGKPPAPRGTLMQRMVREQLIPYKSEAYQKALQIFSANISDVIHYYQERGVPILIGDLISNVHHQPPFVNAYQSEATRTQVESLLTEGQFLLKAGKYSQAREFIQMALSLDTLAATPLFFWGQIQEALGDTLAAYRAFYRAKDLDALRFRASEDLNQLIQQLGRYPGVNVVPVKQVFERHSPHRLPGKELILEHLHPNLEGYSLMAKTFAEAILKGGFLGNPARTTVPDSTWRKQIGVTEIDHEVVRIRMNILLSGWPFTDKPVPGKDEITVEATDPITRLAWQFWKDEITYEQMHVQAAEYYFKIGQLEKAAREYQALIQITPMNPSPYEFLARVLIIQKKYDRALEVLKQLLELEPNAFAFKMIGSIYVQKGEPERGIPYLEKALELSPADPQALYNLAGAYALTNRFQDSYTLLQRLMRLKPDFPGAKSLKAQVEQQLAQE